MSARNHTKKLSRAALAALERLEGQGRLTPSDVVEKARAKTSPLHGYFTWSNSAAAEKWRLEEARRIIRVRVEVEVGGQLIAAPMFVRSAEGHRGDQGYEALDRSRVSRKTATATLDRELHLARSVLRRIASIATVLGVRAVLVKRLLSLVDEVADEFEMKMSK